MVRDLFCNWVVGWGGHDVLIVSGEGEVMQALEQSIKQWADGKWPNRTLASRLRKLGEEFGELAEAVANRGEDTVDDDIYGGPIANEAADCAIVLSDICSLLGYSLSGVMATKFAEVQARPPVHSSTEAFYGRGSR